MKSILSVLVLLSFTIHGFAQQSDFIVLKKRNNRTIKTYSAGSHLTARTHNGFDVNGFIMIIRNDSVYVRQMETRLSGTEFGATIDTLTYVVGMDFRELSQFYYTRDNVLGRKKGFAVLTLPRLMMIGGTGFVLLELINTAYRKESLNDHNKLPVLATAAGVAVAGFLLQKMNNQKDKAGRRFQVVYVKAGSILPTR